MGWFSSNDSGSSKRIDKALSDERVRKIAAEQRKADAQAAEERRQRDLQAAREKQRRRREDQLIRRERERGSGSWMW